MNTKHLIYWSLLITLGLPLQFALAQKQSKSLCASEKINFSHRIANPQQLGGEIFERILQGKIKEKQERNSFARTEEDVYEIPVIVHVVHNGEKIGKGANISAAQVYSQIAVLNEDFNRKNPDSLNTPLNYINIAASANIKFVLASISADGKPLRELGIERVNSEQSDWDLLTFKEEILPKTSWNPNLYFNLWTADLNGSTFGLAQFPTLSGLEGLDSKDNEAQTDGVIIRYRNFGSIEKVQTPQLEIGKPYNLGRTTTHEVAHFFGLLHTWGDGACELDDFCEDTPLCEGEFYASSVNCAAPLQCDELRMIENFMDYSDDACMNLFTQQQVDRMRTVLENSPRRKELRTSMAAQAIQNGILVNFEVNKTQTCQGETLAFKNTSLAFGNSQIINYQWIFEGGNPERVNNSSPLVNYSQAGDYSVTLIILGKDSSEIDTLFLENYIHIIEQNEVQSFVFKNFEDAQIESGAWTSVGNTWKIAEVGALGESQNSISVQNFDDKLGDKDVLLISPKIQLLRQREYLEISFDIAYGFRNNFQDSLALFYSTDCGGTQTLFWKQGGVSLATAQTENPFIPNTQEWKKQRAYININQLEGNEVKIIFSNLGDGGNAIFIDNISIQEADLVVPIADFDVDKTLLLTGESAQFINKSKNNPISYDWKFKGAEIIDSSEENPKLTYSEAGTYDVFLTADNSAGSDFEIKRNYIKVIEGTFLDNVKKATLFIDFDEAGFVSGNNQRGDIAKAEYFSDFGVYDSIQGVDIAFGEVLGFDTSSSLNVVVWAANGINRSPNTVLISQKVPFSRIKNAFENKGKLRVRFDKAIPAPTKFFMGVELDYTAQNSIAIYTANTPEGGNTAWEKTANNQWQAYSKPEEEQGRALNYTHAIFPILSPESPRNIQQIPINERIILYPNPNTGLVKLDLKATRIFNYSVYNMLGQNVKKGLLRNAISIDLSHLKKGLYLLKFETNRGTITKRLVIIE